MPGSQLGRGNWPLYLNDTLGHQLKPAVSAHPLPAMDTALEYPVLKQEGQAAVLSFKVLGRGRLLSFTPSDNEGDLSTSAMSSPRPLGREVFVLAAVTRPHKGIRVCGTTSQNVQIQNSEQFILQVSYCQNCFPPQHRLLGIKRSAGARCVKDNTTEIRHRTLTAELTACARCTAYLRKEKQHKKSASLFFLAI